MIKYLCICLFNGLGLHDQEKQNNVTHLVLDFHSKNMLVVAEGVEETNQASFISGKAGVVVQVTRQPGGNTVQVVRDVISILPEIEASLPPSVSLQIVEDTSIPIKESVSEVEFTLLLTILLVVVVIYAFLRDGMATLIPSLALPLSVVATFPLMFFCGFSLDNMSLMALILVVGFVVDDAIVMLENIIRHREMGKLPGAAAMDGAGEIGFTILSMTVSLGTVFIPLLFLQRISNPGWMHSVSGENSLAMAVYRLVYSGLRIMQNRKTLCSLAAVHTW